MIDPVFAYLDPTSGSIAYQVAISGVLAAAAACRMYWHKLRRFVRWTHTSRTGSHT